jgi:hypothetical protein
VEVVVVLPVVVGPVVEVVPVVELVVGSLVTVTVTVVGAVVEVVPVVEVTVVVVVVPVVVVALVASVTSGGLVTLGIQHVWLSQTVGLPTFLGNSTSIHCLPGHWHSTTGQPSSSTDALATFSQHSSHSSSMSTHFKTAQPQASVDSATC